MSFDIQKTAVTAPNPPSHHATINFQSDPLPEKHDLFLSELKQRAKRNDAESIEYLFTLACEASAEGSDAENFLFELYSGKEPGDTVLKEQLGKDSLRLFTLVQQRNQNTRRESTDIWNLPTTLLIMAAFEAGSGSEQQAEIFDKLKDASPFLDYIADLTENTPEKILAANRYISSAEINAFSSTLQVDNNLTFYPAANVSNNEVTSRNHERVLSSLGSPNVSSRHIPSAIAYGIPASEPAACFIPLLFRSHWILFGWFINPDKQKEAIVLDSYRYLNPMEKNYLIDLAHLCGVRPDHPVTFIDEDLQQNAPNACGLFVSKAMENLCKDAQGSWFTDSWREGNACPTETLRDFARQFALSSSEEQRLFNRHGRAELYAVMAQSLKEEEQFNRLT